MVEGTKPKDYYTDDKGIVHPIFDAGVIAGLTPGSVLFAGAGGIISQDNANLFWDDTNKRLGIGTESPDALLHVSGGDILLDNNESILGKAAGGAARNLIKIDGTDDVIIGGTNIDAMRFNVKGLASALFIQPTTGNVGIGTTSPQKDLHIQSIVPTIRMSGSNAATDQAVATLIEFYRANNTNRVGFLGMASSSNDDLRIATDYAAGQIKLGTGSNVTALTIDSSQKIGIGTSSPGDKFHVLDTRTANESAALFIQHTGSTPAGASYGIVVEKTGATSRTNVGASFSAAGADNNYGLLVPDGKVGIGTTSPSEKLEVNGAMKVTGSIRVYGPGNQYYWDNTIAAAGTTIVQNANKYFYLLSSSEKTKKNIIRKWKEPGFMEFLNINPIKFDYKTDAPYSNNIIGFSAEELQASGIPNLINFDSEGNPQSIRNEAILAYHQLILKESYTQIQELKAEIELLKQK